MADRTVRTILSVEDRLSPALEKASRSAGVLATEVDKAAKSSTRLDTLATSSTSLAKSAGDAASKYDALASAGRKVAVVGAAVGAGMAAATKQALDWESAFAGVKKTVDGVDFGRLETDLRKLAKTMPVAHEEIAATAQAAGALGVAGPKIASFTKTALELGEAVDDLDAQEAATSLAQIANIMGTFDKPMRNGVENVDRFASALVHLGNNGASTEGQILSMAQKIASAGATVGMSEQGVLALSNTLASMGVRAELGGGVTTRALLKINSAVAEGGGALDGFAKLAGTSAAEFSQAWSTDPTMAMQALVEGMAATKAEGGNLTAVLQELGFKGTEDLQVLLALANGNKVLEQSIKDSAQAWESGTAASEEAAKRYGTDAAKIEIAWNNIKDAAIDVGAAIAPVLGSMAEAVSGAAQAFGSLPGPVKSALGGVGALTAGLLVLGGGALAVVPKIAAAKAALVDLGIVSQATAGRVGGALAGVTKAAGALGITLATIDAANSVTQQLWGNTAKGSDEAARSLQAYIEGGRGAEGVTRMMGQGMDNLASRINVTFSDTMSSKVGNFFSHIGSGFLETPRATEAIEFFKELDGAMSSMVGSGNAERAAEVFKRITDEAAAQGIPIEQLRDSFPQYAAALTEVKTAASPTADEMAKMAPAAREAAMAMQEEQKAAASLATNLAALPSSLQATQTAGIAASGAMKDFGKSTSAAGVELKALDLALKGLLGQAFSVQAATDAWASGLNNIAAGAKEGKAGLTGNTDAAIANREAMRSQVQTGTALIQSMAEQGASSAQLEKAAYQLANGLDATGRKAGYSKKETKEYSDVLRKVPAEVRTNVALSGVDLASSKLRYLKSQLGEIGSMAVTASVRVATQGPLGLLGMASARGNLIEAYGLGGVREQHTAQMARAGAWRVWAEPETGGESYIPHANDSRRPRALEIWRETGRILGADGFAEGGILSGLATLGDPKRTAGGIALDIIAKISQIIPPKAPVPLTFDLSNADKAMLRGPELVSLLTGIGLPDVEPAVKKVRDGISRVAGLLDQVVTSSRTAVEQLDRAAYDAGTARTKAATAPGVSASGAKYVGALGSAAAKPYLPQILAMGAKYNVAPELIAAVMKQESGFNPNAGSSAGARGLMQLMPGTFRGLGIQGSITSPNANIEAGVKYLSQQLSAFNGSIVKALQAYNAGPGAARSGAASRYKETQNYVKRVTADAGVKSLAGGARFSSSAAQGVQQATAVMTGGLADRMIAEAKKAVGTMYRYGGGHGDNTKAVLGKTLVDCSGLLGVALTKSLGKNVSDVSDGFLKGKNAQKLSVDEALKTAGAFVGRTGSGKPGHVAISLGDGTILEAPSTGKRVRIRKTTASEWNAAAWDIRLGDRTAAPNGTSGRAGTLGTTAQIERQYKLSAQAEAQIGAQAAAVDLLKRRLVEAAPYLEGLAVQHADAAEQAAQYKKELDDLIKVQQDYANGVAQSITAQGELSKLWRLDTEAGTVTSLQSVIRDREKLIEQNQAFAASVQALQSAGLNRIDLAEIMGMGAEKGGRLAQQILQERGSGVIADLNRTRGQLEDAAEKIGGRFGDMMYGGQVDAAKKVADAWEAEKAGLADTAWQVGQAMQADLLRGLGLSDGALGAKTSTLLEQMRQQWLAGLGITRASVDAGRQSQSVTASPVSIAVRVELDGKPVDDRARVVVRQEMEGRRVVEARAAR